MSTTTHVAKVLLLCPTDSAHRSLFEQLGAHAVEMHEVHSLDEALTALRGGQFDMIVSEESDFLALERACATHQSATVLDTLGQGVCIVDVEGGVVWANTRMRAYPPELLENVREHCHRALASAQDSATPQRARHFSFSTAADQYFEVTATPILDSGGRATQIVAVAWETSHIRRLQRKIDAIDLAGRELVQLDAATVGDLNVEERLQLLEDKIFRCMHELLHFDNFAVFLLDKKTNRLEPLLQHGLEEAVANLDIYASTENNGISGYVAATGRSYICHDTTRDARYIRGMAQARSSLTVPLRLHDQIIGVFNIESDQPAGFNEDDRQYVEILARYIAMSINVLDLLVTERFQVTGRLAEDVAAEIAAPLNDILAGAATMMEEYIGYDDLRKRLGAICDHVANIRKTIRQVGSPQGGILGRARDECPRDPLLFGKRVLVADDEEIVRETVGSVLSQQGCEVETASDGSEAVALLAQHPFDLVLSDIKMPNKTGYEVFAAAREVSDTSCVILMTGFGYDPNHSIVRARQEGLNAVLFKPFKVDQLLAELRSACQPKA